MLFHKQGSRRVMENMLSLIFLFSLNSIESTGSVISAVAVLILEKKYSKLTIFNLSESNHLLPSMHATNNQIAQFAQFKLF